jgi:CsoR family transcriptional regulator, copper-sensing transcriptional repressor
MENLEHKKAVLLRLRRIEGQMRGLQRMVEGGVPCSEILTQVAAVTAAVKKVGTAMVRGYMEECLAKTSSAGAERKPEDFREFHRALSRYIDWA